MDDSEEDDDAYDDDDYEELEQRVCALERDRHSAITRLDETSERVTMLQDEGSELSAQLQQVHSAFGCPGLSSAIRARMCRQLRQERYVEITPVHFVAPERSQAVVRLSSCRTAHSCIHMRSMLTDCA